MKTDDYYQRLGVSRKASADVLRRAFRDQMLSVHPDHNPDDELACQQTREIVEAYNALRDPHRRRRYDLARSVPVTSPIVYHTPGYSTVNRYFGRVFTFVAFILLSLAASMIVRAISESSTSGFKVNLIEQPSMRIHKSFPSVIKPSLLEPVEWCYCQEYEFSMANAYSSSKLLKAYTEAAGHAKKNGDTKRLAYYRQCIERTNSLACNETLQGFVQ